MTSTSTATRRRYSSAGRCAQQERFELHRVGGRELQTREGLALAPSEVLLAAVEPEALERLAIQDGADGTDARPVSQALDQILLAAMGQDIAQPLDLGPLLVADGDRLVPAAPELLPPAHQPAGLTSQVRVEVAHEQCQLARGLHAQKEVEMVGNKGEGTDANAVELLRPAKGAEENLVSPNHYCHANITACVPTFLLRSRPECRPDHFATRKGESDEKSRPLAKLHDACVS